MDEATVRKLIREELQELLQDKYTFNKEVRFLDGRNIQFGKTTGTIIGTETTQRLGFFGKSPVTQQSAISSPVGGSTVDTEARTAINALKDVFYNFGLTA